MRLHTRMKKSDNEGTNPGWSVCGSVWASGKVHGWFPDGPRFRFTTHLLVHLQKLWFLDTVSSPHYFGRKASTSVGLSADLKKKKNCCCCLNFAQWHLGRRGGGGIPSLSRKWHPQTECIPERLCGISKQGKFCGGIKMTKEKNHKKTSDVGNKRESEKKRDHWLTK